MRRGGGGRGVRLDAIALACLGIVAGDLTVHKKKTLPQSRPNHLRADWSGLVIVIA